MEKLAITKRMEELGETRMAMFLPKIFESCHAANLLELQNHDIMCVWFAGSGEGNPDTTVVMSKMDHATGIWSEPRVMSLDPTRSEQNPMLYQSPEGQIWLLYTSNEPHNQKTAYVCVRTSDDNGETWTDPRILFDEVGIFIRHPIITLSNGDWLCPAYYCKSTGDYSVVKISTDKGASWTEYHIPEPVYCVQMNVVETAPGHIVATFRSRRADFVHRSESNDYGRTWTTPRATNARNNNASTQMIRLKDGRLLMAMNDTNMLSEYRIMKREDGTTFQKTYRTPMSACFSDDDGWTWKDYKVMQEVYRGATREIQGFSYPSVMQSQDGTIHFCFTFNRENMKYIAVKDEYFDIF